MALPRELLEAIEEEALQVSPRALAETSRRMTERYRDGAATGAKARGNAEGRGESFDDEVSRVAYAVARLPATFAAVRAALIETAERLCGFSPESVLDLGAGPGTAAWAACEVFPSVRQIACVECDQGWIRMGRRLAARADSPALVSARWIPTDLARDAADGLRVPRHDLVVLSYSLGEMAAETRPHVVESAWRCARQVLVIVEPGTPTGFGCVIEARSRGIALGGRVAAPCPHDAPCPLAGTESWCHFSERLERTRRHRLAKEGALGFEDEKFSYAAMERGESAGSPDFPESSTSGRVIDRPLVSKGRVVLPLCTAGGLERREIPRRDKPQYKQAKKVKWGEWWE